MFSRIRKSKEGHKCYKKSVCMFLIVLLLMVVAGCQNESVKDKSYSDQIGKEDMEPIGKEDKVKVYSVKLEPGEVFQEIDGFGASGAWWAQDIGLWSDENKDTLLDLLFHQEKGIGLSMFRYNVGGGKVDYISDPWRSAETIEVSPGVYDVSRDEGAINVLHEAKERGVETFIAFANTPPARLTKSGKVTGGENGESNLAQENYEAFADYMIGVGTALRDAGIPVDYLSPVNEPQWDWQESKGQEGCHYDKDEAAMMYAVLVRRIQEEGASFIASGVEAGEWKDAMDYYEEMVATGVEINHFAGHSYWSSTLSKKMFARTYANEEAPKLWMSEWTQMAGGKDGSMETAMIMADTIHEDLTILNASSWQYWIAVSKYDYKDGLIYATGTDETYETTKRLYTLGQFSKYIRPGYQRIDINGDIKQVDQVAFKSPDEDEFVLILINRDDVVKHVNVNEDSEYKELTMTSTDANMDMTLVYEGKVPEYVTLTPKSVTTLIMK